MSKIVVHSDHAEGTMTTITLEYLPDLTSVTTSLQVHMLETDKQADRIT